MATPSSDVSITREQLTKYFHLPITDVAKELGICATMLKKICRKNGIPRWPHRKIKSLNKMIESLEASLPNDGSEAGECIRQEIIILKNKKSLIMRNPSILVQGSSNKRPSIEGDEGTPVPSSKKQRVEPEAPVVTTFVNPKPFPPPSSTANSFSINQLLTAPTSFSTPLTSGAMDEKDPYRSPYHAPAHQLHSYSEYKDTKHLSTPPSFSSPLTSYLPPEEDDHARHGDGHPPPSPPPFPSSHPADPYYYHKAALAYQYQYHRQFSSIPQHQQPITQHPYGYPPSQQQQGSPRTSYTSPYHSLANMPQQQLLPPSQSQPQQQQSQQQEQQSQQQQQTTQQSQQAQAQQNQAKPQQTQQQQQPQPSPQKQQAAVPAQKPGSSEALPPLKFRPPSPSSSHPPASFAPPPSEMAYYYSHPHFQSQGYPPQAIPRHPNN